MTTIVNVPALSSTTYWMAALCLCVYAAMFLPPVTPRIKALLTRFGFAVALAVTPLAYVVIVEGCDWWICCVFFICCAPGFTC